MSYSSARWARKPSGHIFLDGREVADTIQCIHCNGHIAFTGSDSVEMCLNCMRPTCGREACQTCMHFEKKLDLYESGKLIRL